MQARYDDPKLGQFYANDAVAFSPERPGYFNRYACGGSDPVNMTDPTGEFGVWDAVIGAAVGEVAP